MAGAMRTLLCSSKIPAVSDLIPSISSNNPRFLTPSPILLRPQKPPAEARRVQANAKGFSGPSHMPATKAGRGGGGGGAGDEEEQIPQVVFERMMVRIVGFVGVPMAAGIGLLHVLGVVKERGLWEVPLWVPFLTTLACFGASALGIAYGTLSSSWDPDRTGSVLGFEEARRNWAEMWSDEGDS